MGFSAPGIVIDSSKALVSDMVSGASIICTMSIAVASGLFHIRVWQVHHPRL